MACYLLIIVCYRAKKKGWEKKIKKEHLNPAGKAWADSHLGSRHAWARLPTVYLSRCLRWCVIGGLAPARFVNDAAGTPLITPARSWLEASWWFVRKSVHGYRLGGTGGLVALGRHNTGTLRCMYSGNRDGIKRGQSDCNFAVSISSNDSVIGVIRMTQER